MFETTNQFVMWNKSQQDTSPNLAQHASEHEKHRGSVRRHGNTGYTSDDLPKDGDFPDYFKSP